MAEDLNIGADSYAIYLPAVQHGSATMLKRKNPELRSHDPSVLFTGRDLNWLDPENKHWHYRWCLASAGHFAGKTKNDIINCRHPNSFVLGDSGGYQIATGALNEVRKWEAHNDNPEHIIELWKESDIALTILRWLDTNCNYAMTIDMPLWLQGKAIKDKAFDNFTETQLTQLTVYNLEFIQEYRARTHGAKFLNVLQAYAPKDDLNESLASEDRWFEAVKDFRFEGWSLGGDTGARGGIWRILRRLLILRDEGLLSQPYNWLHVLGVSTPVWAVYFSAIQRAIRATANPDFQVSFDSSSPYLIMSKQPTYVRMAKLNVDGTGWVVQQADLGTGYAVANSDIPEPFPEPSPITGTLTLQQLNPRKGSHAGRTLDGFADQAVINHNVYVYVKSFAAANRAVFETKEAPADILAAVTAIERLFEMADWSSELDSWKEKLERLIR